MWDKSENHWWTPEKEYFLAGATQLFLVLMVSDVMSKATQGSLKCCCSGTTYPLLTLLTPH